MGLLGYSNNHEFGMIKQESRFQKCFSETGHTATHLLVYPLSCGTFKHKLQTFEVYVSWDRESLHITCPLQEQEETPSMLSYPLQH